MLQYMEHNLLKSRQLIPLITDQHLIRKLARHFNRDIQIAVVTRGIQTIAGFESLLREYMAIKPQGQHENNYTRNKPFAKGDYKGKTEGGGNNNTYQNREQVNKWGKGRNGIDETTKPAVNSVTIHRSPSQPQTTEAGSSSKN